MSKLFDVTFENGKLLDPGLTGTGFDILSVTGGKVEVNSVAGSGGGYGCAVTPMSGHRTGGAKSIHNPASGKFRQAFYFHPNGISLGTRQYLYIAQNYHYDLSQTMYAVLLSQAAPNYQIEIGLADNSFACTEWSGEFAITNDWHLIETYWQRGTPGTFELWIDGISKALLSTVNDRAFVITPGLGALRGTTVSTSGSIYFDDWRANDDGAEIGATI